MLCLSLLSSHVGPGKTMGVTTLCRLAGLPTLSPRCFSGSVWKRLGTGGSTRRSRAAMLFRAICSHRTSRRRRPAAHRSSQRATRMKKGGFDPPFLLQGRLIWACVVSPSHSGAATLRERNVCAVIETDLPSFIGRCGVRPVHAGASNRPTRVRRRPVRVRNSGR